MIPRSFPFLRFTRAWLAALSLLFLLAGGAAAQSTDVTFPTPVTTNEITGQIAPRDIGDARLTRHFYTFNANEGDLSITVESTGLDGDVDLFTASGLRPLTKVTLFGGSSPTRVTKSVYIRVGEPLVLRVEGRASGDAEAVYRIRLEGAFAPVGGLIASKPHPELPVVPETPRAGGRRTTSAGARIEEPPTERAAAPEPTPADESPANRTTEPSSPARRTPARTSTTTRRGTRPSQPSTGTPAQPSEAAKTEPTETGAETPATPPTVAPRTPRSTRPRPTSRNRSTPARRSAPATETNDAANAAAARSPNAGAAVVTATRLIIETKDGSLIVRDMNQVRRVTVENNQLLIIGRDGRIERQPMANVIRMSIEP